MNINHMRGFLLVAETRNITKAAAKMHMTQQALSRILDQLEDELGAKLFTTVQNGTGLTSIGRKILPVIRNLMEQYDRSYDFIRDIVESSEIDIRIAFENIVLLNSYPAELLTRIGNYRVNAYEAEDNTACIRDVQAGKADCAYVHKTKKLNGLLYYPVIRRRPMVIMSRKHYLADRKELCIRDLKDVNHSWLSVNSANFDLYYSACMAEGFFPRITSEYPTAELQHKMLSEGMEVTIGGGFLYSENEKNLVRVPLICEDFWIEVGFIYEKKRAERLRLESYFDVVKRSLAV